MPGPSSMTSNAEIARNPLAPFGLRRRGAVCHAFLLISPLFGSGCFSILIQILSFHARMLPPPLTEKLMRGSLQIHPLRNVSQ